MTTNNETLQAQTPITPEQEKMVEQLKALSDPQALEIAYNQFVLGHNNTGKSDDEIKAAFDQNINELAEQGLMLIPVLSIKQAQLKEMRFLIQFLQSFFVDTKKKKDLMIHMDSLITGKIMDLVAKNIITLNKEEFEKSQAFIKNYCEALDAVCEDINAQVERFVWFESMQLPSVTSVLFFEPKNFVEYLPFKIKQVKKKMKDLQRDVNIGYSQYFVKLDDYDKQLSYLEKSTKVAK
jgi:hypothetical protein